MVVVVGAHPDAEAEDRATAVVVRDAVAREMERLGVGGGVLTLTDLWYVNDRGFSGCGLVCVGGPERNAVTARWAGELASVAAVDGVLVVQFDLEGVSPVAAVWGVDGESTAAAAGVFCERWAGRFVERVGGVVV